MISTILVEHPTLVRVLFWVALVVSAVLGWLLHRGHRSRALLVLAIIGLAGVLALTVTPSVGGGTVFCTVQFSIPFQGIDTLANVALTVPLTLFTALWLERPMAVLAAVSGLSVLIELVQAVIPALGRACDTNDWLMNTVGAAVGAILAIAIIALDRRSRRRRRSRG